MNGTRYRATVGTTLEDETRVEAGEFLPEGYEPPAWLLSQGHTDDLVAEEFAQVAAAQAYAESVADTLDADLADALDTFAAPAKGED